MFNLLKSTLTGGRKASVEGEEESDAPKSSSSDESKTEAKGTAEETSTSSSSDPSPEHKAEVFASPSDSPEHDTFQDAPVSISEVVTTTTTVDDGGITGTRSSSPPPVRLQRRALNDASSDDEEVEETTDDMVKVTIAEKESRPSDELKVTEVLPADFKVTDSVTETPTKEKVPSGSAEAEVETEDVEKSSKDEEVVDEEDGEKEDILQVTSPLFVPRNERYYLHDSRCEIGDDVDDNLTEQDADRREREANRARKARCDVAKWAHDMYDDEQQQPRSQGDLVDKYGYDIRKDDEVPDDEATVEAAINAKRETVQRRRQPRFRGEQEDKEKSSVDVHGVVGETELGNGERAPEERRPKPKRQRPPRRRKSNADPVEVVDDGEEGRKPEADGEQGSKEESTSPAKRAEQPRPRRQAPREARATDDGEGERRLDQRHSTPPERRRQRTDYDDGYRARGRGGRGRGAARPHSNERPQRQSNGYNDGDGGRPSFRGASRGGGRGFSRGGGRGGQFTGRDLFPPQQERSQRYSNQRRYNEEDNRQYGRDNQASYRQQNYNYDKPESRTFTNSRGQHNHGGNQRYGGEEEGGRRYSNRGYDREDQGGNRRNDREDQGGNRRNDRDDQGGNRRNDREDQGGNRRDNRGNNEEQGDDRRYNRGNTDQSRGGRRYNGGDDQRGDRGGYNRGNTDHSNYNGGVTSNMRGGNAPQSKRYSQRHNDDQRQERMYDQSNDGSVKPNISAFPPLGGDAVNKDAPPPAAPLPQRPQHARRAPLSTNPNPSAHPSFDPTRPPPPPQPNNNYQHVARPMPSPSQDARQTLRPKQPTDAVYFDTTEQRPRQQPLQPRPSKGITITSPEHR